MKSCTSILEHMKEDVMKIQQQTPCKRLANFRKDPGHIEGFLVKLSALVSIIILSVLNYLIYFINQPNFLSYLSGDVGGSSQKASK